MLGGHVQLSGNIFNGSLLTIGSGAELIGYGSIDFGGLGGLVVDGSITVRDPQPVLGEPRDARSNSDFQVWLRIRPTWAWSASIETRRCSCPPSLTVR